MEAMDHARCSELLPALERGELDAPVAATVTDHLDGCEDCRLELAGLRALHRSRVEPMTAQERDQVRARIAAAIDEPAEQEVLVPSSRRGFWARLAPALGGIAVAAVVLTGVVMSGGDDTGFQAGDADGGGSGGAGGTEDSVTSGAESAAEPAQAADGALAYYAGDIGKVTQRDLARSVRRQSEVTALDSGRTMAPLSGGGKARNAEQVWKSNLSALQTQVDATTGDQLAECTRNVRNNLTYPIVPIYAATAELDGRPILLIGFRWGQAAQRDLDEYMLWAWPIGDCSIPVFYGSGTPQD
jgi:hypothetical protein